MTDDDPRPVALVTGGGVRLGAAICTALAAAGLRVVVHAGRHAAAAEALALRLGGTHVACDLLAPGAPEALVRATLERTGRLDVLVNNAAIFEQASAETVDAALWQRHFTLNVEVPFRLACAALPSLRASGRGSVVNLLDISALRPYRGFVHYSATKAALQALTVGLAAEWAPEVRVNGVSPGAALFPDDMAPDARAAYLKRVPMGAETGADAVASAVTYLALGPAGVTGQVLAVDGGRSATW
ncbi:MAG: SDR family oxidoreductase [Bradymonadia bacterium]